MLNTKKLDKKDFVELVHIAENTFVFTNPHLAVNELFPWSLRENYQRLRRGHQVLSKPLNTAVLLRLEKSA